MVIYLYPTILYNITPHITIMSYWPSSLKRWCTCLGVPCGFEYSSNIPSSLAYCVLILLLLQYARAYSSYLCFILWAVRLSKTPLWQGYVKERVQSSLVSNEFLWLAKGSFRTLSGPPLLNIIRHPWGRPYTFKPSNDQTVHQYLTRLLIWTLLPNFTCYQITLNFHRAFSTGTACQYKKLAHLSTWTFPTLGHAWDLVLRSISPELALFPYVWAAGVARCFCFILSDQKPCLFYCIDRVTRMQRSLTHKCDTNEN